MGHLRCVVARKFTPAILSSARYLALLLTLGSVGCFTTPIPQPEQPESFQRLISLADVRVQCDVGGSTEETVLGHQYFMGIIPFGRIESAPPAEMFLSQLALEGASRGYRIEPVDHITSAPALRVKVRELSVSGYDLVFMRRPSATVLIDAWLALSKDRPARYCQISKSASSFRQYAFEPELSRVLAEALQDASKELFNCLRLQ